MLTVSTPTVVFALELQYYLAARLHWFPVSGYHGLASNPFSWFQHLLLPAFVLSLPILAVSGRLLQANMLDASRHDYVKTARAKGTPRHEIWSRHILRNAILPIVTTLGLEYAALIGGGTILVEAIFNLNGIGEYAATAVSNFDLPALIGTSLFGAVAVIVINLIVDLSYPLFDARAGSRR